MLQFLVPSWLGRHTLMRERPGWPCGASKCYDVRAPGPGGASEWWWPREGSRAPTKPRAPRANASPGASVFPAGWITSRTRSPAPVPTAGNLAAICTLPTSSGWSPSARALPTTILRHRFEGAGKNPRERVREDLCPHFAQLCCQCAACVLDRDEGCTLRKDRAG